MYLLAGQEDEATVTQTNGTNNRNNTARRSSLAINLQPESHTTFNKSYLVPGEIIIS